MPTPFSFKRMVVVASDVVIVLAAYVFAFLLRFDFKMSGENLGLIIHTLPYVLAAHLLTSRMFALYHGMYHYSSFADLMNITKAVFSGALMSAAVILFILQGQFPRSVLLLHPILAFLGICAVRSIIRQAKTYFKSRGLSSGESKSILLMGAGDMGEALLRQMKDAPGSPYEVVGFIDDDPTKWGMRIHGHPVLGGRISLRAILDKHPVDEIVIAIASKRGEIVRSIMEALENRDPRPELKIAPSLHEMLKAPGEGLSIRSINPADLLNREVVLLDRARISQSLAGKVILVSGAGGTIGSELCRQVLAYGPTKVVLIENHATSLFYRDAELRQKTRGTAVVPVLGDVRDNGLVERVFLEHRPQIVLHAAAHKHVHQLESNLHEGVSNNLLGTHTMAAAADRFGAEAFLLISTDKAVRPAGVMGATKRAAELVVRSFARTSRTRFISVRFGNVLGSSGSVLKIFQEQIAAGGPVTLTDPRATRFFMTVEEAVGLILQAVSMARGGEIFVLKMGAPVRILDMAQNLIRLSGLEPGRDIEIKVTGLRPGEKLDEELVENSADVVDSGHPDILVLRPENGAPEDLDSLILQMELLCRNPDSAALMRALQDLVPTFRALPIDLPHVDVPLGDALSRKP